MEAFSPFFEIAELILARTGRREQRGQIHRMPPAGILLHAISPDQGTNQGGEQGLGAVPPGVIEQLERLVGKVEHVPGIKMLTEDNARTGFLEEPEQRALIAELPVLFNLLTGKAIADELVDGV